MTVPGAAEIVAEHRELLTRVETLILEFCPALPAGVVIATAIRCRDQLMRAGKRHGLAADAEAVARALLQDADRHRHRTSTSGVPHVRHERQAWQRNDLPASAGVIDPL